MKVIMISRSTLYTSPGGDTMQIHMTAKYLRSLGVEVDILTSENDVEGQEFDLIHFFNIIRPDDIMHHIKKNRPYVISTVFVDYSEFDKIARPGISGLIFKMLNSYQIEYVKCIARFILGRETLKSSYFLFHGQYRSILYIANHAKLLLPNSHSEYKRFQNAFGIFPYKKVVNAVDPEFFNDSVVPDEAYRDHILVVGRIEGIKNQLNVIKAVIDTPYKLTIIGKPSLNQRSYYKACRKLADGHANIDFVEQQADHKKLASIYKAARVHVLASWFETTGLVSLEAGLMGCQIVVTRKGDTEEYFKDMALYCEPDDVNSIRTAIVKAYNAPANNILKSFIKDNYTWTQTAKQTLEAYQSVLSKHDSKSA
ncbi:MAG TPA: glycosyltransferase family 4 protein [Flavitalea sp.]|nr:glycosyltransferase family 4 protein [Flavitalea sp.]